MTKFNSLAATLAASAVGLSLFGGVSQAQAASLVPQTEGEVTFGAVNSLGYTVTSLDYDGPGLDSNQASRLFVDNRLTENTYDTFTFEELDAGTNPDGFWFRPVAVDSEGNVIEDGHLEVGKFKFDFSTTIKKLKLTFFDVEDTGTLINNIVGTGNPASIAVAQGPNSNIQTVFLHNVKSFDLKAGRIGGKFPTGDGIRFQIESVPEPTTILGLGALGLAGAFGLRKGKKASQAV